MFYLYLNIIFCCYFCACRAFALSCIPSPFNFFKDRILLLRSCLGLVGNWDPSASASQSSEITDKHLCLADIYFYELDH